MLAILRGDAIQPRAADIAAKAMDALAIRPLMRRRIFIGGKIRRQRIPAVQKACRRQHSRIIFSQHALLQHTRRVKVQPIAALAIENALPALVLACGRTRPHHIDFVLEHAHLCMVAKAPVILARFIQRDRLQFQRAKAPGIVQQRVANVLWVNHLLSPSAIRRMPARVLRAPSIT